MSVSVLFLEAIVAVGLASVAAIGYCGQADRTGSPSVCRPAKGRLKNILLFRRPFLSI